MLSFTLTSPVQAPLSHIKEHFTSDLLINLSPPFPQVSLERFDGCRKADQVILKINLLITQLTWSSIITDEVLADDEWFFVDEGVTMPFGLRFWRHKHRVKEVNPLHSLIIDEISFDTGMTFLNYLLFPFLWGMIFYRKPLYKKYLSLIN